MNYQYSHRNEVILQAKWIKMTTDKANRSEICNSVQIIFVIFVFCINLWNSSFVLPFKDF